MGVCMLLPQTRVQVVHIHKHVRAAHRVHSVTLSVTTKKEHVPQTLPIGEMKNESRKKGVKKRKRKGIKKRKKKRTAACAYASMAWLSET